MKENKETSYEYIFPQNFEQPALTKSNSKEDLHKKQHNSHHNQNEAEIQLFQYSEKKIQLLKGKIQDLNQDKPLKEIWEISAKLLKAFKKIYQITTIKNQDTKKKYQNIKEEQKQKYQQLIVRYKDGALQIQQENQKLEQKIIEQEGQIKLQQNYIEEKKHIESLCTQLKEKNDQFIEKHTKKQQKIAQLKKLIDEKQQIILKVKKENESQTKQLEILNQIKLDKQKQEDLEQQLKDLQFSNEKQQRVILALKNEKEKLKLKLQEFKAQKQSDINQLKEENEKLGQTSECKICYYRQIEVILPCGHCYCQVCTQQMQKLNKMICSFCHAGFTNDSLKKIYF